MEVIFRHPSVDDFNDFNSNYLNKLLENFFVKQKSIFQLEGSSINILNYNDYNQTYYFFRLSCLQFIYLILRLVRITGHSNTFVDDMFSNIIGPEVVLGILMATIFDYQYHFATILSMFENITSNKSNIFESC